MDDRRVADYFVVAGLPDNPEFQDDLSLTDAGHLKSSHNQAPITDIGIVFPSLGETVPPEYELIEYTPTGLVADLNHGSFRSLKCFVCFRRGRDKPPLVDIGVMYEGKEWLMADAEVVQESVGKHVANVNNSTAKTFITFRRGTPTLPCNALVVTDVCVVVASMGESPPHAFCCINKNLNKGIVGSNVFLCYKKSMNRARLLTYKPAVLSRYPQIDLPHFPFPNSVPLFCLPMGATLELWPNEVAQPRPVFSTFVLTVSDAKYKVYGSAVTFYERFPEDQLTDDQRDELKYDPENQDHALHVNKSICVLSHWPFSDCFERWLIFLHDLVASGKPQPISIEKYIVQLLDEVPFPSPRTLLQLTSEHKDRVILTQPEDLPLPRSAAGFRHLLSNLGPENCLQILLLALTEQKILIHSLRPDTLTAVGEAVSSLLFPFKWQCPYIPLCPLGLVEVLHAPLPFLIGVDSRFFDLYDPPPDVSCVDLDTNIITVCEAQRQLLSIKLLPKRAAKCLKNTLEEIYSNIRTFPTHHDEPAQIDLENEFQRRKIEQTQELEIQEAFLRFMACTLKGYGSYLLPITKAPTVGTTDPQALFQLGEFQRSRDKSDHKFFTLLMRTQMFIRFIEERSFVADGDQGLAFFDECIERLPSEEGDIRFLEPDLLHTSERTVFLLPPEPASQNESSYIYKNFTLDPTLLLGSTTGGSSKQRLNASLNALSHSAPMPGSPMARRTKHEIKSAQKLAKKCIRSPELWARCLLGTCHTLYFMALPSMLSLNVGKERTILQQSYEILVRATQLRLNCDEVCYRLMMQLCGEYSRPLLAVKLLLLMRRSGIQPNALTYGLYNRCVLEAEWPAHSSSSQLLWNKLRYVVLGAAHFRRAAKRQAASRLSASTEGSASLLDQVDRTSRSSLDSHEAVQNEGLFEKFRSRISSIVRVGNSTEAPLLDAAVTSAGLLMSGQNDAVDEIIEEITAQEEEQKDVVIASNTINNNLNINLTPPESPSDCMRLLSRSESASDAGILDKLQQHGAGQRKPCAKALHFNHENDEDGNNASQLNKQSPSKISPRTPVTENDPLGALEQPPTPPSVIPPLDQIIPTTLQPAPPTDTPVLFRSSVQRSATFEGSPPSQGKIHRSETVPAATVASSLASLSSTFKINFSRYSPARLSLRKADLKVPQQLLENAINNFSPSSLTGKKSNELIQGSISSIKSAATTVAKKLDEIKEAISTTSTPVKGMGGGGNERLGGGDADGLTVGENDSTDGSEGGERHRRISAELGSYKGSTANLRETEELPENLYPVPSEASTEYDLELILTSCSQCHNCSALIYDEDIMSSWSAEDSNLNTTCQACSKSTVPFLTIIIIHPSQSVASEPFSIPYLNPLVLRKELENILSQEGDLSLASSNFVEEHPIIYWNLVWAFERINVQTHLPNLCLKNKTQNNASNGNSSNNNNKDKNNKNKGVINENDEEDNDGKVDGEAEEKRRDGMMVPVEDGADPLTQELNTVEHLSAQVGVKCLWDDPRLHGEGPPMYMLWQSSLVSALTDQTTISKSSMQSVIASIHCNDLLEPLKKLANERQKIQSIRGVDRTHSIYRDILFLACKAVGRANIDLNAFDKEYSSAFVRIPDRNNKLYRAQDKPLSISSSFCRQYFKPLTLP